MKDSKSEPEDGEIEDDDDDDTTMPDRSRTKFPLFPPIFLKKTAGVLEPSNVTLDVVFCSSVVPETMYEVRFRTIEEVLCLLKKPRVRDQDALMIKQMILYPKN